MKLKKIASLMLAGIMAVSMLAACGEGKKDDSSSSSSESTGASGYSAMLADELKDVVDDDYVTFKDNADDQKALTAVLGGMANQNVVDFAKNKATAISGSSIYYFGDTTDLHKGFADKAKVDAFIATSVFGNVTKVNGVAKVGVVYAADGSVSMDKVMKDIATNLENDPSNRMSGLAKSDEVVIGSDTVEYDYDYVVSVSVVNVANDYDLQKAFSTNFIAVTITRTATEA